MGAHDPKPWHIAPLVMPVSARVLAITVMTVLVLIILRTLLEVSKQKPAWGGRFLKRVTKGGAYPMRVFAPQSRHQKPHKLVVT